MEMDGRYEGSSGELSIVLRLDTGVAEAVSADLYRGSTYVASVRTGADVRVIQPAGRWAAVWQDEAGAIASGAIATEATDAPGTLRVGLRVDRELGGFAPGAGIGFDIHRVGADLRDLGLEVERETGVVPPVPVLYCGDRWDERKSFRAAGFAVTSVGVRTEIPRPPQPWDFSTVYTLLHDLMTSSTRAGVDAAAWELHLLLLSTSSRDTINGIMFDPAGVLPRQGSAVFVDAVRANAATACVDADRGIIRTIVHELGHALNLAHRFEPEIGRADSTSFMNYPWKYTSGGSCGYWRDFRFTFDPDELSFLRHAPMRAVRPGDTTFHSVHYWADGAGLLPPAAQLPRDRFSLALRPPATGPGFVVGQPILLEVVLENLTDEPVQFPIDPLDVKNGLLTISYRPAAAAAPPAVFVPMMQACVEPTTSSTVVIEAHGRRTNNVSLGFGAGGHTMPAPGQYELTPRLQLPDGQGIIIGGGLLIRIDPPAGADEERDAEVLLRPDVGAWFALGGADGLQAAGEALDELAQRRLARNGPADPVVSAVTRAAGINAGRASVRWRDGRYLTADADPALAARLLSQLDADALRNFDPHTAAATAQLARDFARRAEG